MASECSYCKGLIEEGSSRCPGCGAPAPVNGGTDIDFRTCPYCHRKLLALASPACSYCGKRLPDNYIKAREADLRRIGEINEFGGEASEEAQEKSTSAPDPSSVVDVASDLLNIF